MTTFRQWVGKAKEVRVEDVIAEHGIVLRGRGVDRCGPCPVCGEGDDRFHINTKKQVFGCRQCGGKGDVIELTTFLDGCDRVTAITKLAGEPMPRANGKSGNGLARAIAKKKQKDKRKDRAPKLTIVVPGEVPEETTTEGTATMVTVAEFEYFDQDGKFAYTTQRKEFRNLDGSFVLAKDGIKRKKTFRQYRIDENGDRAWNLDGVERVLYRLPELVDAVAANRPIFVVEGEAKVDALREVDVIATTNVCGAKAPWLLAYSEYLRGADVVLLPDNDETGWKHVTDIASSLAGIAARIRVVMLPDLPEKGDVKDWLAAGGTREQFDTIVEAAQDWQPPSTEDPFGDDAKKTAEAGEQALIDELSKLNPIAYDQRRNNAADQIGVRRETRWITRSTRAVLNVKKNKVHRLYLVTGSLSLGQKP